MNVRGLILTPYLLIAALAVTDTVAQEGRLEPLAAGDSVSVRVFGESDMDGTLYVNEDGAINIPLAGAVHIQGLTPIEAGDRVEAALKEKGILLNPHVTVTLAQAHVRRVSVLGEVRNPGRYVLEPGSTIFDVLALAGGVTEGAADSVRIARQDSAGQLSESEFFLRGKGANGEAANPVGWALQNSDRIYVPAASRFYIQGEVRNPNSYRIERGLTYMQAISLAGGLTDVGSMRRLEVTRAQPDGKKARVRVKLDDPVQPDDVIVIKESLF